MAVRKHRCVVLGLLAAAMLWAGATEAVAGAAMDFVRLEPRWVAVQVVTTIPGDPEPRLSAPALAWYQAGPGSGQRTVTVPGSEVERVFFADRSPVQRSFSDFVWVFDSSTGHVVSASFSGLVEEPVRIGPLRSSARVAIAVELSTRESGGYRSPYEIAGRTVVGYCPDPAQPGCTSVASAIYDPGSGRVRANGAVCATWRSLRTRAYTSLGHAQFRELDPAGTMISAQVEPMREKRLTSRTSVARPC